MMNRLRERLSDRDGGFTLIELMVVVLIIAILIAIAIPTFLGARERAQDRAAQSDLRNSLTAAKVYYVDNEHYNAADTDLEGIEPSIDFDDTVGNASTTVVGFAVEDVGSNVDQAVVFVKQSSSGTWFCIADTAVGTSSGTTYGSDASAATGVDTVGECDGTSW